MVTAASSVYQEPVYRKDENINNADSWLEAHDDCIIIRYKRFMIRDWYLGNHVSF